MLGNYQQQGQLDHGEENEQEKQAGQHEGLQSSAKLNCEIQGDSSAELYPGSGYLTTRRNCSWRTKRTGSSSVSELYCHLTGLRNERGAPGFQLVPGALRIRSSDCRRQKVTASSCLVVPIRVSESWLGVRRPFACTLRPCRFPRVLDAWLPSCCRALQGQIS